MDSGEQNDSNSNIILFKSVANKLKVLELPIGSSDTVCQVEYKDSLLAIRNLNYKELDDLRLTWVKQEGWPTIRYGLPATYKLDQEGFYVLEKGGKKLASISVVSYPNIKLAYIGFFIVPQDLRGQGYGGLILNKTIEYSKQYRGIKTFGLNCVESMVPMYEKWGFETKAVDEIWKFTTSLLNLSNHHAKVDVVDSLNEEFFNSIVNYDAAIFGAPRAEYLYYFMHKPDTVTLIYQEDGNIQGYGIISERDLTGTETVCNLRIGPLYAEDYSIAKLLLQRLMQAIQLKVNQAIFMETPGNNPKAAKIVKELGFEKIMSLPKMYNGPEPKQSSKQIFAYSSLVTGG